MNGATETVCRSPCPALTRHSVMTGASRSWFRSVWRARSMSSLSRPVLIAARSMLGSSEPRTYSWLAQPVEAPPASASARAAGAESASSRETDGKMDGEAEEKRKLWFMRPFPVFQRIGRTRSIETQAALAVVVSCGKKGGTEGWRSAWPVGHALRRQENERRHEARAVRPEEGEPEAPNALRAVAHHLEDAPGARARVERGGKWSACSK